MAIFTVVLWSVIVLLLIYRFLKWSFYRPEGFPPGPPRVPFLGGYFFLILLNHRELHKAALKLSKFYKTKVSSLVQGVNFQIEALRSVLKSK